MNTAREKLKKENSNLYTKIEKILFEHDLMGVNFGDNTDEYAPEVDTIIPRLKSATSADDVSSLIKEEFCTWFGDDIAQNIETVKYDTMAKEVWLVWRNASS
jgi:hypothetical protein